MQSRRILTEFEAEGLTEIAECESRKEKACAHVDGAAQDTSCAASVGGSSSQIALDENGLNKQRADLIRMALELGLEFADGDAERQLFKDALRCLLELEAA